MTITDTLLTYSGTVIFILFFLYATKNYFISLVPGYLVFCVFWFKFGVAAFDWTINSMAPHFLDAAKTYIIAYAISVLIYRIFPSKNPVGA